VEEEEVFGMEEIRGHDVWGSRKRGKGVGVIHPGIQRDAYHEGLEVREGYVQKGGTKQDIGVN